MCFVGCNDLVRNAGPGTANENALTREGHKAYFPIESGRKHADIQCSECHEDSTSFKTFTCVSCHAHAQDVAITRAHICRQNPFAIRHSELGGRDLAVSNGDAPVSNTFRHRVR